MSTSLPKPRGDEVAPETVRWLAAEARVARPFVLGGAVLGWLEGLAGIGGALSIATIVARSLEAPLSAATLAPWLAGLAVALVLRALLGWARQEVASIGGRRVQRRVRRKIWRQVVALGPARAGERPAGELVSAAVEQAAALDGYAARFLPQRLVSVLVPLTIVAVVARHSWAAALILLATAPNVPLFAWLIGLGAARASQRQFQALSRMGSLFLDRLRGLTSLRVLGQTEAETEAIGRSAEGYRLRTMKVLRLAFLSSGVLELFSALGIAMMALYLGFSLLGHWRFGVTAEPLDFRSCLFMLLLAADFYAPLRALGSMHHARAEALGASEALRSILADEPPSSQGEAAAELPESPAPITLDRVSLSLGTPPRPVLDELSLKVEAGQHVALVGPSGAGKTTALQVLMGLLPPDSGSVRVGDVGIESVAASTWHERIGWVGQQPTLFHGTIRSNIALGRADATDGEVEAAARAARVVEFSRQLPEGLDSEVGEEGAGLSVGQIQRVALARAYLSDAPVLVLDEPTASLDVEGEALVLEALETVSEGRTVVMATHRSAACRAMDRVLLIEDGHVVDGSPSERICGGGDHG